MYGVPESRDQRPDSDSAPDEAVSHINKHLGKDVDTRREEEIPSAGQTYKCKCRPLVLHFDTSEDKHVFLRHVKTLRINGPQVDKCLTKEQQKERQALSADFLSLKETSCKPFFRASLLKYLRADKVRVCKRGQAHKPPDQCDASLRQSLSAT